MANTSRLRLILLPLSASTLLVSCGGNASQADIDSIANVCSDSEDCVTIAETGGHGSAVGMRVLYNPTLDDEVTRWASCLDAARTCFENASDVAGCVAQAEECPEQCSAAFSDTYSLTASLSDNLDAFEAVFLDDGAMCQTEGDWE